MALKDIRIFVASSKELVAERNALAFLVLAKEDEFERRGLRVRLSKWEYVDPTMTEARTEDRYLEEMYACDGALVLFRSVLGMYTREEMEKALDRERSGNFRLKAHRILFKEGDGAPSPELAAFRASLPPDGYGTFAGYEGLKAEFLALVERLVELDGSGQPGRGLLPAAPDSHVRRITAFLAADDELAADRDAFADTVLNLNDLLELRNLRVRLRFCGPGLPKERLAALVSSSEMGLVLYGTNVRAFGACDLDDAYARTCRDENPRKLYVFFRDGEGPEAPAEFRAFRDSIVTRMGHFACQFGNADALRLAFLLSLERHAGEIVEVYSTAAPPSAPVFVGREDELRRLHALLMPDGEFPAGRLPVVTGAGGTGKSELVRQFASQFRARYPGGVLQADMEHARTWDDAFLALLEGTSNNGVAVPDYLGLKGKGSGDEGDGGLRPPDGAAVRDAVLRKAREAGPMLLVLDNVDDVEACEALFGEGAFAAAFPAGLSEKVFVHVVATGRVWEGGRGADGWAAEFPLGDLSPEAALGLLLAAKPADTPAERDAAARVAELLGRRALLLRHVPQILRSANRRARIVCRTYASLAQALERDALSAIARAGTVAEDYWPARLWELAKGSLDGWELGEACVKLVEVASFFSPDGFPAHVLRHLWEELVYPGLEEWGNCDEVFEQVLDIARSHNFLQSTDPVRMHRLDRAAVLRTAKADPSLEDAVGAALAAYADMVPDDWLLVADSVAVCRHVPEALRGSYGVAVMAYFWGELQYDFTLPLSVRMLEANAELAFLCDWNALRSYDWRHLLCVHPGFGDRCNWEVLSGLDIGLLLAEHPEFADRCALDRMDGRDWGRLLAARPEFADRCPWESLDAQAWRVLLSGQPRFAERCPWEKFSPHNWSELLRSQPQFAARCPWEKFSGFDWRRLLSDQPQFADRCDWSLLDNLDWSVLLPRQPQFTEHCPMEMLDGSDWCVMLKQRPDFADRCAWEKLNGSEWCSLLVSQPQFADRCAWEKLLDDDWEDLLKEQPQFAKWREKAGL